MKGIRNPDHGLSSVYTPGFWEQAWEELKQSFLAEHQTRHPDRWKTFYDLHGPFMREISGLDRGEAAQIVDRFLELGVVSENQTVVDLGCGSGWLALPMARKGMAVTAVDTSTAMLAELEKRSSAQGLGSVVLRRCNWDDVEPAEPFDLALAACFPPVLSPEGLLQMAVLGKTCALLLPDHLPGPSWTGRLWEALFGRRPFTGGRQLQTAVNYLMAAGKKPSLVSIRVPFTVNVPLEKALEYYAGYFSLFDRSGTETRAVIEKELLPFTKNGRITARGDLSYGLVWWAPSR